MDSGLHQHRHGKTCESRAVRLAAVAEASGLRCDNGVDAGLGDRGDDGDLQRGEYRPVEAVVLPTARAVAVRGRTGAEAGPSVFAELSGFPRHTAAAEKL